ncbi:hypothetical protein B0619_07915 [Campylobacter lari]|nr:hypothetical protein [Campylobacter lari]
MDKIKFNLLKLSELEIEKDKFILEEIKGKEYYITSLRNFCKILDISYQVFHKKRNIKYKNIFVTKIKKKRFKIVIFEKKYLICNMKNNTIYYVGG